MDKWSTSSGNLWRKERWTALRDYTVTVQDTVTWEKLRVLCECVLPFAITVQAGNHIYYTIVIKMILNGLKCAWRTYFLLHLCETNRVLVVTPKMMVIFCMLKHIFYQSLCWQLCNKSCGFAGYEYIQSMGDFSFGAQKCMTPMTDLFYFVSILNLLLYRIFKIER
jgi:hypothetical protein